MPAVVPAAGSAIRADHHPTWSLSLSSERLFEIHIGVYATDEDITGLVERCTRLLDGRSLPYHLSVATEEQTAGPGPMPLAEFYEDLPHQWRIEHPGADAGPRSVHQIRVGQLSTRPSMDTLRAELTRVICPDPDHHSPCPIPWASGHTDDGDGTEERERTYLDRTYGHLRHQAPAHGR